MVQKKTINPIKIIKLINGDDIVGRFTRRTITRKITYVKIK